MPNVIYIAALKLLQSFFVFAPSDAVKISIIFMHWDDSVRWLHVENSWFLAALAFGASYAYYCGVFFENNFFFQA